jgi:hypothetical protein
MLVGAGLLAAACGVQNPGSPSVEAAQAIGVPSIQEDTVSARLAPPSSQIARLDGLVLSGYCQSLGHAGATLTKPQIGPNAAFNNWRCATASGDLIAFSMEQACKWQYSMAAVQTHPLDRDDAYTWLCYATPAAQ